MVRNAHPCSFLGPTVFALHLPFSCAGGRGAGRRDRNSSDVLNEKPSDVIELTAYAAFPQPEVLLFTAARRAAS